MPLNMFIFIDGDDRTCGMLSFRLAGAGPDEGQSISLSIFIFIVICDFTKGDSFEPQFTPDPSICCWQSLVVSSKKSCCE